MNRMVCKCLNTKVKDVFECVEQLGELDIEKILDVTNIGIGCKKCLDSKCSKIDIDIFSLVQEIKESLNESLNE